MYEHRYERLLAALVTACIMNNPLSSAQELADILTRNHNLRSSKQTVVVSINGMFREGRLPDVIREHNSWPYRFRHVSSTGRDPAIAHAGNGPGVPQAPAVPKELRSRIISMLARLGSLYGQTFYNENDVVEWLISEGIARHAGRIESLLREDLNQKSDRTTLVDGKTKRKAGVLLARPTVMTCPKCGYKWKPMTAQPKKCPNRKCQYWLYN